MNLGDLISRGNFRLQHNPQMQAYSDGFANIVAEEFGKIASAAKWLFLQKEIDFPIHATINSDASITATFTNAEYAVVLGSLPNTAANLIDSATLIDTNNQRYRIVAHSSNTVYLDQPYIGTSGASTDWVIQFDRYLLPRDCHEPLAWCERLNDRGWRPFIDRFAAELEYRDRDDEGDIEAFIEDDHEQPLAPASAPTLTVGNGGSNALAASTEYDYGYTTLKYGIESPMSPTARGQTTASNRTITLSALDDTRDGSLATGVYKVVYRRDVTNNGRWLRFAAELTESTTTYEDDNSPVPVGTEADLYYPEGARQWVRPWPRASTTYVGLVRNTNGVALVSSVSTQASLRLRYQRMPRPLVGNGDVPDLPEAYHPLILHRAVENVAMMAGQSTLATFHRAQAKELWEQMLGDKRCIERSNRVRIRGDGIAGSHRRPLIFRFTDGG